MRIFTRAHYHAERRVIPSEAKESRVNDSRASSDVQTGEIPRRLGMTSEDSLAQVTADIVNCFKCPRLVAWREQVGRENEHRDDGLALTDAYISACVRCAPPDNKPLPVERVTCLPYLKRELDQLPNLKVVVCLGAYALEGLALVYGARPRPRFGHALEHTLPDGNRVLCSFHPSQQNTFTGKLTVPMFDAIFARARQLITT